MCPYRYFDKKIVVKPQSKQQYWMKVYIKRIQDRKKQMSGLSDVRSKAAIYARGAG